MRGHSGLLLVASLLGALTLVPTSAAAAGVELTCVGGEVADYRPGLQLLPRQVDVEVAGTLGGCVGAVTGGTYGSRFPAVLSCATLLAQLDGTRTFHWNDRSTSTFTYRRILTNLGGQTLVTFTGTITAGRYAGATAVEQVVFASLDTLRCLTPAGLTTLGTGIAALTITS